VNGDCCEDNPDALTHQEVLLPGHLLLKFIKEKLEDGLITLADAAKKLLAADPEHTDLMVRGLAGLAGLRVCVGGRVLGGVTRCYDQ
jgi:hypothetical protein